VEITQRRTASAVPEAQVGMSAAQRFGREALPPMASNSPPGQEGVGADDSLHFDLPAGWTEIAPTSMRMINLQPGGEADASCYVSVLGGDGGGLANNLNRWRGQLGLDPAPEAELLALPTVKLIGGDATLIELVGDYAGMGGEVQPDWGLLGAVASTPQATVFVKMTAPAALIGQERENFLAFVASLHFDGQAGGDPHGASPDHQHDVAETDQGTAGTGDDQRFTANGFRFAMPEGWSDAGPRTMRTLNFGVGKESECYLVVLGGDGGGLAANLNRWQGQMGLDPLSEGELAALPLVPMLGEEAPFLIAHGDYAGMGDATGLDHTMLGIALIRPQNAVFLKMTGPEDEVAANREAFLAFAADLEEVK